MSRLVIATPTPGSVKTAYLHSVVALMRDLRADVEVALDTCEGSDIALQRNILASRALAQGATHVFFLDSDMTVAPGAVRHMLELDKAVIGALYPRRRIDLAVLAQASAAGSSLTEATTKALQWFVGGEPLPVPANVPCFSVTHVGAGALLIRRDALETMIEKGAVKPTHTSGANLYNFFGPRADDATVARHRAEDESFCLRWRLDCGGEIWAMTDLTAVKHIGDFTYGAG